MPFCGHASAWSKLELLLLVPAISLHCAGLGTPYWMKTATTSNDVHLIVGLWKMVDCSGETDQPCVGQALLEKYKTGRLKLFKLPICSYYGVISVTTSSLQRGFLFHLSFPRVCVFFLSYIFSVVFSIPRSY